jgi:hypothetical protein
VNPVCMRWSVQVCSVAGQVMWATGLPGAVALAACAAASTSCSMCFKQGWCYRCSAAAAGAAAAASLNGPPPSSRQGCDTLLEWPVVWVEAVCALVGGWLRQPLDKCGGRFEPVAVMLFEVHTVWLAIVDAQPVCGWHASHRAVDSTAIRVEASIVRSQPGARTGPARAACVQLWHGEQCPVGEADDGSSLTGCFGAQGYGRCWCR